MCVAATPNTPSRRVCCHTNLPFKLELSIGFESIKPNYESSVLPLELQEHVARSDNPLREIHRAYVARR